MTPAEFKNQIKGLIEFYGAKKFPQEIIQDLWSELGILEEFQLEQQIDSFIQASIQSERKFAPTVKDFKNALFSQINEAKKKINDELKKKHEGCLSCCGSGVVIFFSRSDKFMTGTAFQCECPLGPKLYPTIGKQFQGMEKEYMTKDEYFNDPRQVEVDRDSFGEVENNDHNHGGEL